MEDAVLESTARPKADRKRLQSSLQRSIEAHKLRLQKARGAKPIQNGRLCECKSCDVTSTKPSMMCLKAESKAPKPRKNAACVTPKTQKVASEPQTVHPYMRRRQPKSNVDKPILGSGAPRQMAKRTTPPAVEKKVTMNEEPAEEALKHIQSFAEYCEAFGIKDAASTMTDRTSSISLNTSVSSVGTVMEETASNKRSSRSSIENDASSSRSQRSARQSLDRGHGATDGKEIDEATLKMIAKQLETIRIVDSKGEEHSVDTLDLERKILTAVNKIVNEKLSRDEEQEVAHTVNEANTQPIAKVARPFACCQQRATSDDSIQELPSLKIGSSRSIGTAGSAGRVSSGATTLSEEENVDKYKNVVDVLLDYISTSRSARSREAVEKEAAETMSVRQGEDVKNDVEVTRKVVETTQENESSAGFMKGFMLWGSGKKSFSCCNTVEAEPVFLKQQTAVGAIDMTNAVPLGSVDIHGLLQGNYQNQYSAPSAMESAINGQRQATGAFIKMPSSTNNYMMHVPQLAQQMTSGLQYPVQQQVNKHMWYQSMACCPTQAAQGPCPAPIMSPQMLQHAFHSATRLQSTAMRRHTPSTQQAIPQQQYGMMQQVMTPQRMYTGMLPGLATGSRPARMTTMSAMQSPIRQVHRQATGPVYRRNTGRAYVQQVQAAMS